MTNITANGWSWGSDTYIVWEMPSGKSCTYTGTMVPISTAQNGITLCEGAQVGITGSVYMPSGTLNDGWCEIRISKDGGTEYAVANGNILNNRAYWSAGQQTSWFTVTSSGTYTFAFVYRYNGDYYGAVLQKDVPLSVLSMEEDPVVTVQNGTSFFTGFTSVVTSTTKNCYIGASGDNCKFVVGSPVKSTISVFISGGNPNGVEYKIRVDKFYYGIWTTVHEEDVGILLPGGGSRYDIDTTGAFDIEDAGVFGTDYRIVLTHRTVHGTQMEYPTQVAKLFTKDESADPCNSTTCQLPKTCRDNGSGVITCQDPPVVCVAGTTRCKSGYTNITQTCVNNAWVDKTCLYGCNQVTTVCNTSSTSGTVHTCSGMNRNGEFDITCIFDEQNKNILYVGIAAVAAIVLLKR